MENKILLERFKPYVEPHKDFDIALSKFGPLYVYPVDRKWESHEAEVLDGPKGIIETVAFQMMCDAMEPLHGSRVNPTEAEVGAVRSRIQALVSGLDFEAECMETVDRYLSQYYKEKAAP